MSKLISPSDTATWLKEHDNYLIITHRRPDGDTIGCAGALAQGLSEIGKTVYVLQNPEATPRYVRFMESHYAPKNYVPNYIITVDTASVSLFPENAKKYKDSISLCIDHHNSNSLYADLTCLNDERAACGEIIFDILMIISGNISNITAERLYVALSTDTGCFAFGNTTSNTLYIASLLIESGAQNKTLNKELFRTKTRGRIKMEGLLTSGMEFSFKDKVAVASITREMIETADATEDDMDDIASIPGSIEGVCIGITIREMSAIDDCKISVRTISPHDAQAICAHFGGGGHKLAAGASIKKTIKEIKKTLHEILHDYIY